MHTRVPWTVPPSRPGQLQAFRSPTTQTRPATGRVSGALAGAASLVRGEGAASRGGGSLTSGVGWPGVMDIAGVMVIDGVSGVAGAASAPVRRGGSPPAHAPT